MIKKCGLLAISLLVFLPWTVSAQDAKAIVANAAKAMGIQDLGAVGSFMYSGTGATFELGQSRTPNSPWPKSGVTSYRRTIDFDAAGSLEVINRMPAAAKEQVEKHRVPFREHYGVEGKQYEIWMTPVAFLKGAAAAADATVKPAVVAGKQFNAVSFTYDNNPAKYKVTGYFDSQNLLERAEARVDNPLLGDMLVEAAYTDYKDFGHGLVFPAKIVEKQGGYPVLDLDVTDAVRNAVTFDAEPINEVHYVQKNPDDGGAKYREPFLGAPIPISVDEALYGESVYYIRYHVENEGQADDYHSVLVEFNDYLVLIEAPLDEAHSNALLKEVRIVFGNKPIRYIVNTHAHLDAAGGLRAIAAAEGATIITQAINKPYYDKLFALPRTVRPDNAAQAKKKIVVEGMAEKRILTDGTHVIELNHIQNESADGMLIAYLPKEKIVVEADLYVVPDLDLFIDIKGQPHTPEKAPVTPYAAAFAKSLDSMKLDYTQILALQGRAMSKKELLEDVKQLAAK